MEYLVELTPGREAVYDTPLALRAALRSGEITGDSRIYHRRSGSWLSIMEHPEYRRLLAERRPPDWLDPIPYEPVDPATLRKEREGLSRAALRSLRDTWAAVRSSLSAFAAALARRAHSHRTEPAGSAVRTRESWPIR